MNLFQLVQKNMRQRALSTWLTLLSVMLGVGLAISIIILGRESEALFGQKDYGYDVLVGKKGSPLQLTLNTVYHMDVSPGNIPFDLYSRLTAGDLRKYVKVAVPTVVGDTYQGKYRIVGTLPKLFGCDDETLQPLPDDKVMEYRQGKRYAFAEGRIFTPNKFEAVLGSEVSRLSGLKVGSTFQATHGSPKENETPDIHKEVWTVVGILAPTHTSNDRVLYIPLNSFYTIAEHGVGLMAQEKLRKGDLPETAGGGDDDEKPPVVDADGTKHFKNYLLKPDGTIHLTLPYDALALSAILVQSRGGVTAQSLMYDLNNGTDVMGVNPASVMREFFDTFLKPSRAILFIICSLVTVVAAVGILVSIYNSVSARTKEIAILRALGATREKIVSLICLEAALVAAVGAVLGIGVGHAVSGAGSYYMDRAFGQGIHWLLVGWQELGYLLAVVLLAAIAGLAPALKAYQTPVATNLVAS